MIEKLYVILSKNNTYCNTINESKFEKFKKKYNLTFKELVKTDYVNIVKHEKYNATKLKYMIWGIWEVVKDEI